MNLSNKDEDIMYLTVIKLKRLLPIVNCSYLIGKEGVEVGDL